MTRIDEVRAESGDLGGDGFPTGRRNAGVSRGYRRAVIATASDQALRCSAEHTAPERAVFGASYCATTPS